jgi:hypothetical protein
MNSSQLAACAKFLGEKHFVINTSGKELCVVKDDGSWTGHALSDAELFYALLLKAFEQGLMPSVYDVVEIHEFGAQLRTSTCPVTHVQGMGPEPLDALAAAIEALSKESGNAKD